MEETEQILDKEPIWLSWPDDISLPEEYLGLQPIAHNSEKPKDIVPGVCFERSIGVLVAPPFAGKTLLLGDLGLAMASGQEWLKWKPLSRTPTLIYALDSPGWEAREQIRCLMAGRGLDPDVGVEWKGEKCPYPFAMITRENAAKRFGPRFNILHKPTYEKLRDDILAFGAKFVGIDSMSKIHPYDEIKKSEMEPVMEQLTRLAHETGAFVLLLHHTPVNNDGRSDSVYAGRGSSVIAASCDFVATLKKETKRECGFELHKGRGSDEEGYYLLKKERVEHPTEPRAVRWVIQPPKAAKIPQAKVIWKCIAERLANNVLCSKSELTQAAFDVGVTVDIANYLSRFVAQGLLKVPQRGHYMLTQRGKLEERS